jgi:type I restriction enzyme S subunit
VTAQLGDLIQLNPKNYVGDSVEAGFVPLSFLGTRFRQPHAVEVKPWRQMKRGYTHFADGDVVLARITPSFENGKAGIIRNLPNGVGAGSTEYFVCRPLKGVLNPEFLLALFKTDRFLNEGEQVMNGAVGQQRVPKQYLTSRTIALPPYREQERIAAKLESLFVRLDACYDRLTGIPAMLSQLRDSALTAAITGALSEEWRRKKPGLTEWKQHRLADLSEHLEYGSSAKSSPTGSVPVLRMGNIQSGALDWSDLVYTSDADEIKRYGLKDGDVLFNRTNSPELVGKTAVFKGSRAAIFAGYLIRIRCLPSLEPDFLSICLNSPAGREFCRRVKSDGVSQSNISATKLAEFNLSLPSVEEQREIVSRYDSILSHIEVLRRVQVRTMDRLRNLEQSIFKAALTGKLVSQDEDDEPAQTLLETARSLKTKILRDISLSHKQERRAPVKKFSKDVLRAAVQQMSTPSFTSDQLRAAVTTDYEHFKDALFGLLDEPQPTIMQEFDPKSRSIVLTRVTK